MKRLVLCTLLTLTLVSCSQSPTSEPSKVQEKAAAPQPEAQKDAHGAEPAASTTTATTSTTSGDTASAPAARGQQQPASASGTTATSPESSTGK